MLPFFNTTHKSPVFVHILPIKSKKYTIIIVLIEEAHPISYYTAFAVPLIIFHNHQTVSYFQSFAYHVIRAKKES